MNKRMLWSRILCGILCVAGVAMTALALSLDGQSTHALCLLSGIGLVALSAFLGDMRHRALVYGALALGVVSVAARIAYFSWLARHGRVEPGGGSFQLGLPLISYIGSLGDLGPWATVTGASIVLLESLCASTPPLGGVSMSVRRWRWSRILCIVWLAMIAVGTVANLVNNSGLDLGWMEMPISVLRLILPIIGIGLVPLGSRIVLHREDVGYRVGGRLHLLTYFFGRINGLVGTFVEGVCFLLVLHEPEKRSTTGREFAQMLPPLVRPVVVWKHPNLDDFQLARAIKALQKSAREPWESWSSVSS